LPDAGARVEKAQPASLAPATIFGRVCKAGRPGGDSSLAKHRPRDQGGMIGGGMREGSDTNPAATGRDALRLALASLIFTIAASAVFFALPGIDIWVSGLFYRPGVGFPLGANNAFVAFRSLGNALIWAFAIGAGASLIGSLAFPRRRSLFPPNIAFFLISTFALGPGVIVNLLLKEHWGRPRPYSVDLFGGTAPYVDVWRITDFCTRNCSFVSGESSAAIWLLAVAAVVPKAHRRQAMIAAGALTVLLSLNRIAFGAHFLSDVVIAWGLTATLMALCYRAILVKPIPLLDFGGAPAAWTRLAAPLPPAATLARRIARGAVVTAALGGLAFMLVGRSSWPIERGIHETIEWIGVAAMGVCACGLAWHALDTTVAGGLRRYASIDFFRVIGAVGVGAQFGSIAVAIAAGVALLASLPLAGTRRGIAAPPAGVDPARERLTLRAVLVACVIMLLAMPVAEGVERLQQMGVMHVSFYLP
jgi:membrane-associated PAP2 superfamily phosphatase